MSKLLDRSMRIIEEIRGRNLPGVRDKREERGSQEKRDGQRSSEFWVLSCALEAD